MSKTFSYSEYQTKLDEKFGAGHFTIELGSYDTSKRPSRYIALFCNIRKERIVVQVHSFVRQDNCPSCYKFTLTSSVKEKITSMSCWKQEHEFLEFTKATQVYRAYCHIHHKEFSCTTKNTVRFNYSCPDCTKDVRDAEANKQYLKRFDEVWQGRYTYNGFFQKQKGGTRYVRFVCKDHGEVEQRVDAHLNGIGCQTCGHEKARITFDEFLDTANKTHDSKYNYSKVVWNKGVEKITITCPVHGDFVATAIMHMRITGCGKCAKERQKSNTEEFIKKSIEKHGNNYIYDLVEYDSSTKPVKIVCKIHGVFEQTPNSHLVGSGCRKCNKTGFNLSKPSVLYVYCVEGISDGFIGFGISSKFKNRDMTHRKHIARCGYTIAEKYVLRFEDGLDAFNLEAALKNKFRHLTLDVEGFKRENTSIENKQAFEDYIDSLGLKREYL